MASGRRAGEGVGIMAKLTPRQQDVVVLLAQGYSQKEAAKALGMAYGTIRKHTLAARTRTECRSTVEIVVRVALEQNET